MVCSNFYQPKLEAKLMGGVVEKQAAWAVKF
jgi:hypothetical protein